MKAQLAWLCAGALVASCAPTEGPGGQLARGRAAMARAGCGACHMVPGIPGATGAGGPSLDGVARRVYLAGVLPNTTANLTLWIKAPQSVLKGNAMPDTNLSAEDAEAIVAYLQTLR